MSAPLRQRTRSVLAERGLRPLKRLGQHFLVDAGVARDVVAAAEIGGTEAVLEIGAGLGALTELLAERARRVVAVEVDWGLAGVLRDLADSCRVEVIQGDFLELDLQVVCGTDGPWKIVGNLPYCITTPILESIFANASLFALAVVTVQAEVAERLLARPGGKDYGALTLFAAFHAEVEVVRNVPSEAFYPQPGVASSVLRLRPRAAAADVSPEAFEAVARGAFAQRRKTIVNSLVGSARLALSRTAIEAALREAGIRPDRRGETLALDEFCALARAVQRGADTSTAQ